MPVSTGIVLFLRVQKPKLEFQNTLCVLAKKEWKWNQTILCPNKIFRPHNQNLQLSVIKCLSSMVPNKLIRLRCPTQPVILDVWKSQLGTLRENKSTHSSCTCTSHGDKPVHKWGEVYFKCSPINFLIMWGLFVPLVVFFVLVNLRHGVLFLSSCLCHYLVHSICYYWTLHLKGIHK